MRSRRSGATAGPISEGGGHGLDFLVAHDLRGVRIVAHSKGGLVGKQIMALDPDARVERLIAIRDPVRRVRPCQVRPGADACAISPRRRVSSPKLGRRSDLNARITLDLHAAGIRTIPGGSKLEGARNIELPLLGHFRLLADELLLATVEHEAGMD